MSDSSSTAARPAAWNYRRGLAELGDGAFAYLQPDGGWGWSNAGLITDGDQSLLVDTLFDLTLTRAMLDAMRRASKAAASIDTLVNTHANGDHCWGNQLVSGAEVIATRRAGDEMAVTPPKQVAMLMKVAGIADTLGPLSAPLARALDLVAQLGVLSAPLSQMANVARAGSFVKQIFGDFSFDGIDAPAPSRTFDGALTLSVGDKPVELIEVGPAHTTGDAMVYSPRDRVLFAGDILFIDAHPIIWEGPVSNWIAACERILAMPDLQAIVPGHGPITDKAGVQRLVDYLRWLFDEASARYAARVPALEAATEIARAGDFSHWIDGERLAVNVATIYRELGDPAPKPDVVASFAQMAAMQTAAMRR